MNSIDENPKYKEIYNFVKSQFESTDHFYHGPFDETYYSLRVYESSKEIIAKLNKIVNTHVVLVAAILHDVGKTKLDTSKIFSADGRLKGASAEWDKHPGLGPSIAQPFLEQLGHSPEFIEQVCYLIKNHDQRGDKMTDRSIELQILQDADLIADCGFAGFIRPVLYGPKFSRGVIQSINFMKTQIRDIEEEGLINLEVSKIMTVDKIKLEKELIEEISKDIDSDLL